MGPADIEIATQCGLLSKDPLGWIMFAFNWGIDPDLSVVKLQEPWRTRYNCEYGPDVWFCQLMDDWGRHMHEQAFDGSHAVQPFLSATASGHGIGKSFGSSLIILFIASTRPHSKGVVTANTSDQLKTKTWGELGKWKKRCITGHWFEYNNGKGNMTLYHKDYPESWRVDAQTCREENSESFAGLHAASSSPWYLFDEACHDDRTEVLTESGWKLFADVTPNDRVMTKDPVTNAAEYIRPIHLHSSKRVGVMYEYVQRGASFCVTPNHNMHFTKYNRKKGGFYPWRFDEIQNIKTEAYIDRSINWAESEKDKFVIPGFTSKMKQYPDLEVDLNLWCQFLGWYCSEGSLDKHTHVSGMVSYTNVRIAQKNLDQIKDLVERLGFEYSIYKSSTPQLCVKDRRIAEYLGRYGSNCLSKSVPDEVKRCSKKQIGLFIDTYVQGDGYSKTNDRDIIYSSSPKMADDLQILCLMSGAMSSVTKRKLTGLVADFGTHKGVSSCDGYVISRSKKPTYLNLRVNNLARVNYDGMVYCLELPRSHLLFTRRDGYCMWSGNSAVPDKIWEVGEGGMTDGEPFWFVFGNPTRNTGRFRECFRKFRHRWRCAQVDSRSVQITNKGKIEEWAKDYGDDSDFFKVRVKGQFPSQALTQFIPEDIVRQAMGRHLRDDQYSFAPKIISVDPAWEGDDALIIAMRQGLAFKILRSIPKNDNDVQIANLVAQLEDEHRADAVFIDGGYGTGIVSVGRTLGRQWQLVWFSEKAINPGYVNKRAEMWGLVKDWLRSGGAMPHDEELAQDLMGPETVPRLDGKIQLESKKDMKNRGLPSPNKADALAITFAYPVYAKKLDRPGTVTHQKTRGEYNPY